MPGENDSVQAASGVSVGGGANDISQAAIAAQYAASLAQSQGTVAYNGGSLWDMAKKGKGTAASSVYM